MKTPRIILLSLCFSVSAHAASLPNLGGLLGGFLGNGGTSTSQIQTLVLNAGLTYAMSDPRFAPVLAALGINNAQDLQNFLQGDSNGNNFQDIIVHAAFQYAQSHSKYSTWLAQMGVVDEPSLNAFLDGKGAKYENLIFSLALQYAQSNPKYSEWLDELEIDSVADIQDIANGDLQGTNLQDLLVAVGTQYVMSNPKYSKYMAIITLLLGNGSLPSMGGGANPLDMFLGAYEGLPVSEIKTIQKAKKMKAKRRT